MLSNFSFLIENTLAGCALPGNGGDLMEDLTEASEAGITAIVSLTENALQPAIVREAGMKYLHIPVEDFSPPTIAQVEQFVTFVEQETSEGGTVLAHCFAGVGRTGTMLAAYLIHDGATVEDAIRKVRSLRPGSVESASQIALLERYARHLKNGK